MLPLSLEQEVRGGNWDPKTVLKSSNAEHGNGRQISTRTQNLYIIHDKVMHLLLPCQYM